MVNEVESFDFNIQSFKHKKTNQSYYKKVNRTIDRQEKRV